MDYPNIIQGPLVPILLLILSLVGAFYWFEWRPINVREGCSTQSSNLAIKAFEDSDITVAQEGSFYSFQYQSCLNEKGFKE